MGKENGRTEAIIAQIKKGRQSFTVSGRTFYPDPDKPDGWVSDEEYYPEASRGPNGQVHSPLEAELRDQTPLTHRIGKVRLTRDSGGFHYNHRG